MSRVQARHSLGQGLFGLSIRGDGTLNLGLSGSWNSVRIYTLGAMQGFINHDTDMSLRWNEDEEQSYVSGYELGSMLGMLGDLHAIVGGVLLEGLSRATERVTGMVQLTAQTDSRAEHTKRDQEDLRAVGELT